MVSEQSSCAEFTDFDGHGYKGGARHGLVCRYWTVTAFVRVLGAAP